MHLNSFSSFSLRSLVGLINLLFLYKMTGCEKGPCPNPRAVFNCVSKVIRVSFGFALLCSVIGLKKNTCHFPDQLEVKPKTVKIYLRGFSRALPRLHVFASSFEAFVGPQTSLEVACMILF